MEVSTNANLLIPVHAVLLSPSKRKERWGYTSYTYPEPFFDPVTPPHHVPSAAMSLIN